MFLKIALLLCYAMIHKGQESLVNPLKLHSFSGKAPHSEAYPCLLIVIVTDVCVKRYFFVIKYRYAFRERKQLKYILEVCGQTSSDQLCVCHPELQYNSTQSNY